MEFKKIVFSILFIGLVGSHVLAMDEVPGQTPEDAANQVADISLVGSKRPHNEITSEGFGEAEEGVCEPETKRRRTESQLCISDLSQDCLMLIFEFATGGVGVERDPIENFVALKKLCKKILPVCKMWRVATLQLIKFDLEGIMNSLESLDEDARLMDVCLAKRVLDSVMHDAKIKWYKSAWCWVRAKILRCAPIMHEFDSKVSFGDLSKRADSELAKCFSKDSNLVNLVKESNTWWARIYFKTSKFLLGSGVDWIFYLGMDNGSRADIIKMACILGANPNSRLGCGSGNKSYRHDMPLIHFLIDVCDFPSVCALISCGANVNQRDALGRTPLRMAIGENDNLTANALVEAGALVDEADLENLSTMGIDISKIKPEQIVRK